MKVENKIFNCIINFFIIFSSISVLLLTGCSSDGNQLLFSPEKNLVWPEPPETPRIRYIGSISTEADLQKAKSFIQNISELVLGKKKVGVLVCPYAIAVDQDNRLFVTDTSVGSVHVFDLQKRQYRQFGKLGGVGNLQQPVGIAIGGNLVYVVDSILHEVCVFDKKGKYLFAFGSQLLKRPSGISYKEDNQSVYVVDTGSHTIMNFTSGGKFIQQIGSRGIGPGMFNFPTQIWVNKDGKFYVSDTLNYRVQVFTDQWMPQRIFGQQGDIPGTHYCDLGIPRSRRPAAGDGDLARWQESAAAAGGTGRRAENAGPGRALLRRERDDPPAARRQPAVDPGIEDEGLQAAGAVSAARDRSLPGMDQVLQRRAERAVELRLCGPAG